MAGRRDGQIVGGEGKWQCRWFAGRDANGKRHYKAKTIRGTRRDAEKELRRILRSRDTGEYVEPSKEMLDAYLKRWLAASASRVSPRTLADYKWLLDKYVSPHLGTLRLEQIRPLDVQEWLATLSQTTTTYGRKRDEAAKLPPKVLSARTIRLAHAILSSALAQGVKWGLLYRNPAAYVDRPRQPRTEMQVLSAEQVVALRRELASDPHRALIDFLVGTGARPGEALALRWSDLDLDSGRVTIQRALTVVDGMPSYKSPKTSGSTRRINLPGSLVAVLRQHRGRQAEHALALGASYERDADLVFPNNAGRPLDLRNVVGRHFKPALERAKLPQSVRLYDLRHTHATGLLAAGIHPKVAAERLGHSTTRQTLDTYSHVLEPMRSEATEAIDHLFFGGRAT